MSALNRLRQRVNATIRLSWAFGAVLGLLRCTTTEDPTGGETHFLTMCTTSAPCGDGLSCVCGVCTRPCSNVAQCENLPMAACVPFAEPSTCTDAGPLAVCDVPCNQDDECRGISPNHRCVLNTCRSGASEPTGGTGGSSTGGTSGQGGSGGTGGCATDEIAPNEVLVIGDSFFAISHQITAYLEQAARDAGVLAVGERYRDNSATVDNGLAMGGNGITAQYQRGVDEGAVRVVIMDGGGVDVLLSTCADPVSECPALVAAADAAEALLAEMAADGVSHVVYAFYPDPVDAAMRERMDALRLLIEPVCAQSPVPCHWVDLRATFASADPSYLSSDGLIPTAPGSQMSAGAIWATMKEECVAQ